MEHTSNSSEIMDTGTTPDELSDLKPGDLEKTLEGQIEALNVAETTLGPDHPDTATALTNIGVTYGHLGNNQKSLDYHDRAFNILNNTLEPENQDLLKMLNTFMTACIRVKKHSKAYNALNSYLNKLPTDHPEYDYLVSFKNELDRQGTRAGFRPPSAQSQTKKKKKRNKKKR